MTFDTLSLSLVYKKRMLANVIKKRKAKTLWTVSFPTFVSVIHLQVHIHLPHILITDLCGL